MTDRGPVSSGAVGDDYLKEVKNPLRLHAPANAGATDAAWKLVSPLTGFRFLPKILLSPLSFLEECPQPD